jgi:hypothetical protein
MNSVFQQKRQFIPACDSDPINQQAEGIAFLQRKWQTWLFHNRQH